MKKIISIALVLVLALGVVAFAGCSNDQSQSSASSEAVTEAATEAAKTETVKFSKFNAYVTYDPNEFYFDDDLVELVSKDETLYIYGSEFDETEVDHEKEIFENRESKSAISETNYSEMDLDHYHAKTVTYKNGNEYDKDYFITFDEPINDWAVGATIHACMGDTLDNEAKIDAIAKTFEVKPKETD